MLERGPRYRTRDFRQSMDIDHLSDIYLLIQGQGAQGIIANAVGGGSNLYLAASLRSPSETFERRDQPAGRRSGRRMWPQEISRATLDPYYGLRRAWGCACSARAGSRCRSRAGCGRQHSRPQGHTCDRVPLAISPERCIQAKWCHTGCIYGAKNSVITNYLCGR